MRKRWRVGWGIRLSFEGLPFGGLFAWNFVKQEKMNINILIFNRKIKCLKFKIINKIYLVKLTKIYFIYYVLKEMKMAGQIRMSPEELKSKATRYGQGANQIEDILSQLQNLQNELRGEWEGRAFEGFDQQFNQLKPKVQNFAQLLQEINMQLNKTAEAVASHDEELSRNFGLN